MSARVWPAAPSCCLRKSDAAAAGVIMSSTVVTPNESDVSRCATSHTCTCASISPGSSVRPAPLGERADRQRLLAVRRLREYALTNVAEDGVDLEPRSRQLGRQTAKSTDDGVSHG